MYLTKVFWVFFFSFSKYNNFRNLLILARITNDSEQAQQPRGNTTLFCIHRFFFLDKMLVKYLKEEEKKKKN